MLLCRCNVNSRAGDKDHSGLTTKQQVDMKTLVCGYIQRILFCNMDNFNSSWRLCLYI